ncbi:MAG: hypothetical protein KatS3mg102_2273 [Planctomycetota bacterium]|nr:MAG: hypothetical protein KatS3mg102_2273 [Planctomycetota bacterium]
MLLVSLALGAGAPATARADVVTLDSDEVIEGRIVEESPTEITIEFDSGRVVLRRSQIRTIERRPWRAAPPAAGAAAGPSPSAPRSPAGGADAPAAGRAGEAVSPASAAPPTAPAALAPEPAPQAALAARLQQLLEQARAAAGASEEVFTALGPEAVPLLAERLRDRSLPEQVREAMAVALQQLDPHPAAVPALVVLLHDSNPIVALNAAWSLGALADQAIEAAPTLRSVALDGTRPAMVRAAALYAYDAVGGAQARETALALLGEPSELIRARARQIVRAHFAARAAATLQELTRQLDGPEATARAEAALLLGELGDTYSHTRLIGLIRPGSRRDPSPRVRLEAVRALRASAHPEALAALLGALEDEDAAVRAMAALVLGRRQSRAAVAPLLRKLYDIDPAVRRAAARALEQITGQRHGTAIDRWRRWWESEGKRRFGEGS